MTYRIPWITIAFYTALWLTIGANDGGRWWRGIIVGILCETYAEFRKSQR